MASAGRAIVFWAGESGLWQMTTLMLVAELSADTRGEGGVSVSVGVTVTVGVSVAVGVTVAVGVRVAVGVGVASRQGPRVSPCRR